MYIRYIIFYATSVVSFNVVSYTEPADIIIEILVHYVFFSVSFIFGAEPEGGGGRSASFMADSGGLVARGEGTAVGKPYDVPGRDDD